MKISGNNFILNFLAAHLQRAPTSGAMLPQNWLQPGTAGLPNNRIQLCEQQMRIQTLRLERESLKQRQAEIMRKVFYIYIQMT